MSLARGNLIFAGAGLIPGHLVAIATTDIVGRKPLQICGFAILMVLFCVIGFAYDRISKPSIMALLSLCNFIGNAGPNTTTFIVPGELFPTRYRATAYGVSSAAGKIGSILSQAVFIQLINRGGQDMGVKYVFRIYALFM